MIGWYGCLTLEAGRHLVSPFPPLIEEQSESPEKQGATRQRPVSSRLSFGSADDEFSFAEKDAVNTINPNSTKQMARHRHTTLNSFIRASERIARQSVAAARRRQREQERLERQALREQARRQILATKEAKEASLAGRQEETNDLNEEIKAQLEAISAILDEALGEIGSFDFEELRNQETFPPFHPDPELVHEDPPPEIGSYVASIRPLSWFEKLVPGAQSRYERLVRAAQESFVLDLGSHTEREAARKKLLAEKQSAYEVEKATFEAKRNEQNENVENLRDSYRKGEGDAVVAYNTLLLEASVYPDGFPKQFRVAYSPVSQELVIERELPAPGIVPDVAEYRYIKTRDSIESKPRRQTEVRAVYQDVVASIALRTLHEVFNNKENDQVKVVIFNGYVDTIDPGTGREIKPFLISVRATREQFFELNLRRVEKVACLRNLGASVSPRPDERLPVKPIVEFDMVDRRFVDSSDLLGALESRPNLMELTPFEFEQLVGNLFSKMNLETRQTRTSRDGGVDVVAFDTRPVLGGKVVIQAKRYRHAVGVSAARDLYGTMINEGANKGILVTTSGYGPDAFEFCKDKPIELIDGGNLLYLLQQHAGLQARIVMPAEGSV